MITHTFDIECYANYFLCLFRNVETGTAEAFEIFNNVVTSVPQNWFKYQDLLIGFNSIKYDMPMLMLAMNMVKTNTVSNASLLKLSNEIIIRRMMPWTFERQYGLRIPKYNHIDLIEVAPGKSSLKIYGGRIGSVKLQDLPVAPGSTINVDQIALLRKYCFNDNILTADLYNHLKPQLELREKMGIEYGVDLRSKSDAQIAEAVIAHEYKRITGNKLSKPNPSDFVGKSFKYEPPAFITFHDKYFKDLLAEICAADFFIGEDGKVIKPPCLDNRLLTIANKTYKMGIGGFHSKDKPAQFESDDNYKLVDIDVTSHYPKMIMNAKFYPKHMGPVYLEIIERLINTRIKAKECNDEVTADSMKIVINGGTFGKLGSIYSKLFSPDLLFHVTITGQLSVLMLLEHLSEYAISANTDGMLLRYPKTDEYHVKAVIKWWEDYTKLNMESTSYTRINMRDISNYLAIKVDGKLKGKGMFSKVSLMKNPVNQICIDAVKNYIQYGATTEETIYSCPDIRKFLTLRTVKGGAEKDGQLLGKSIRWYYATSTRTAIHYRTNGNTVPRSKGARPLMDIPQHIPDDLDRQWYINEADDILDSIGA